MGLRSKKMGLHQESKARERNQKALFQKPSCSVKNPRSLSKEQRRLDGNRWSFDRDRYALNIHAALSKNKDPFFRPQGPFSVGRADSRAAATSSVISSRYGQQRPVERHPFSPSVRCGPLLRGLWGCDVPSSRPVAEVLVSREPLAAGPASPPSRPERAPRPCTTSSRQGGSCPRRTLVAGLPRVAATPRACLTLGNACMQDTDCCSSRCAAGTCQPSSWCGQGADICAQNSDCCAGVCNIAAAAACVRRCCLSARQCRCPALHVRKMCRRRRRLRVEHRLLQRRTVRAQPGGRGSPPFVCFAQRCVPSCGTCRNNADCCPG